MSENAVPKEVKIILGSQSPRRHELMRNWFGDAILQVIPPSCAEELSFDDLSSPSRIEQQLSKVVEQKQEDVMAQVNPEQCVVVCADTIVVARRSDAGFVVLGKPPADAWQPVVRDWFEFFYSENVHEVWTGFEIASADVRHSQIVKTSVAMPKLCTEMIEWYLSTGEPPGKAGGYAIQGQAAMFIEKLDGSLTNVIGLPMYEVTEALRSFGVARAND